MMFEVKMTGKSYKALKDIVRETGRKPHEILEELIMGNPEYGEDEFNGDQDEVDNDAPIDSDPIQEELVDQEDKVIDGEVIDETNQVVDEISKPLKGVKLK